MLHSDPRKRKKPTSGIRAWGSQVEILVVAIIKHTAKLAAMCLSIKLTMVRPFVVYPSEALDAGGMRVAPER